MVQLIRDTTISNREIESYISKIIHEWSKTLSALVFTLVPFFYVLDNFTMPQELLPRFAIYRAVSTILAILQFFFIKKTKPGKLSYIHGYITSFVVGGMIVLMTVDLGGFNSRYYAGLNLVIIAVNMLLPWGAFHSAVNGFFIIMMYCTANLVGAQEFSSSILINNLFFLCSTVIIAVSINFLRQRLIKEEFYLRSELKIARDALWGEMSIAKKIQTSLLPNTQRIGNYQIASSMIPADEVGGDYYDIIETEDGEKWVSIGDVSGHGVESGLIMMMTQTSLLSILNTTLGILPSMALRKVNRVMRKNLSRLKSNRYMTIMAIKLEKDLVRMAGKHQDVFIYRAQTRTVETMPTRGTWIGLVDDISEHLIEQEFDVAIGDFFILFTDGITETVNESGEFFGEDRLKTAILRYADLTVGEVMNSILQEVLEFQNDQDDDISLLVVKRIF